MESSEDKTRRKYLALLTQHEWQYQYSIFYQDYTQSRNLLLDMKRFKQRLIRVCPDQPFLVRIQLLNRNNSPQAFLTIFTTQQSDALEQAHAGYWASTNLKRRAISEHKRASIARSILKQKPHNLPAFFQVQRVRRYSVLNEGKLIPIMD